jgi:TolB-like protein
MSSLIRFDCFEVDLAAGWLLNRGVRLRIREQSFQVLAALLERPGEVVTRDDLRRRLWPSDVFIDFENSLNAAVARLRRVLRDSAERPRFIETLPKHGYRFLGSVSRPSAMPERPAAPRIRVLVLPLVNLSGDPGQEYFSDAMTDELITALTDTGVDHLAVIARTTSMHYKRTRKDVATIARELDLGWVVEGSARRVDGRTTILVQLVRGDDQTHVFARRFDADLDDLFALHRSVARELAQQMGALPPRDRVVEPRGQQWEAGRAPTKDVAAYNLYAEARRLLSWGNPSAGWLEARRLLDTAVERDPDFALAYEALAELWWYLGFFAIVPAKEALTTGLFHALRALEIDDSLGETHALVAQYRKQLDFNWVEVHREMVIAFELDPRSPEVLTRRAVSELMPAGRLDEAVIDLERALEVDPLGMMPRAWLAIVLWLRRDYDRSIEQARHLIDIEPGLFVAHFCLGLICCDAKRLDEATEASRRAVDLSGGSALALGCHGYALAVAGDVFGARAAYDRLRTMSAKVYVPPTSFALIHVGLGERDACFEWLDRAVDERDHMITPIKTYPFLDPIRDDPRYAALLEKMRLA